MPQTRYRVHTGCLETENGEARATRMSRKASPRGAFQLGLKSREKYARQLWERGKAKAQRVK